MNKAVTSREELLSVCRRLVMQEGLDSISMRSVATACGVSVGALYNYFSGKEELLRLTTAEVWKDIFHAPAEAPKGFLQALRWFHRSLAQGNRTYPGFLTVHALGSDPTEKDSSRALMAQHVGRIKAQLLAALRADGGIHPDALAQGLAPDALVDLLFDTIISLVMRGRDDLAPLLQLVRQALY